MLLCIRVNIFVFWLKFSWVFFFFFFFENLHWFCQRFRSKRSISHYLNQCWLHVQMHMQAVLGDNTIDPETTMESKVRGAQLQWRHNGRDSLSNHQPHDCLLNRLFRRRSKKTSKLRVTGLCAGNSPGEFPAQMASNAENVSIWWRHHDAKWSAHRPAI